MYMKLCPEGAEGASYAMLTTFGNIAMVCSNNIGEQFSKIWLVHMRNYLYIHTYILLLHLYVMIFCDVILYLMYSSC